MTEFIEAKVDDLRPGDQFVFATEFGGENQIVTAMGRANNLMGTRTLAVEEEDFDLEFYGNVTVTAVKN